LAVAEAIHERRPGATLSFVGIVGGFERPLIEEAGVSFASYNEVRAGPLHGVSFLRALASVVNLILGTFQALALIGRLKPQALLLTGGWVGLPVALAAWLRRIPILIYVPDIEPGLTIQMLKRFARRVAITVPESGVYFRPEQVIVTGYPVRRELMRAAQAGRPQAIQHFNLDPARKTLLVWGGSRGARTINYALLDILPDLLAAGIQIIHVTGTLDWPDIEARTKSLDTGGHYHAYPYLHEDMALAFAAADLTVSRAGASILGEYPLFGLPSILVPYPFAWRYQKVNADYLASRGAAVFMEDGKMSQELLPAISDLMADDERRAKMASAVAALAKVGGTDETNGAWNVARELIRLSGEDDE
jgi:UDP-N-acetylglucosamine--N-acetylmuramyl-(pentapeptide) pyrophosphoryl-undecaprenol N-acetylglucosamine transferase